MSMSRSFLKKAIMLSAIFLALCALPKTVLASVLDSYTDGTVYDVTAYGADKTGASSCSSAVSDAVKAAKDGEGRAVIYFPSGTYYLSDSFKLFSNMVIAAESDTVIQAKGTAVKITDRKNTVIEGGIWRCTGSSSNLINDNNSDLVIKNLTIDKGSTGMYFYSADVTVENVVISGCTDTGISSSQGTLSLKNVKVSGAKTGIGFYKTTSALDTVTVTGNTGIGMTIKGKSKVTAQNITVTDNGDNYPKKGYSGHGIGVYSSSKFTVTDSTISNNRECGISLSDDGKAVVKNCVMEKNGRHAVGTNKVCTLTMSGCTINKNGLKDDHDGISIIMGSKATITNCKITNSACSGILLTGASTLTVKNCTFKGNKAHNIYVENLKSGKAKVTVNGGKFYKCKTSDSIRVHVKKTSQYKMKLKGSIKYYNKIKKGYTLWIGNSTKMIYKKK